MKDFCIREARPEDAAQLIAYLEQIGAETDNLTFGKEGLPLTAAAEEEYIRAVNEQNRSVMFVAVMDGRIIGDGSLTGLPRRMQHRAELGIAVIKEQWNKGVGTALMRELIAYAKSSGIELVELDVRADNLSAIRLYEKFGFAKVGALPAYFKLEGEYIDFMRMSLDLRSQQGRRQA